MTSGIYTPADPIGFAKWVAEQYWEGECGDLDAESVQSALVGFGIVAYRKPTAAEYADPEWWGHAYDMERDDDGVGELTPEFKAMARAAKEDAEAERIDNSQFGVGA